jgi:hypothetical protein
MHTGTLLCNIDLFVISFQLLKFYVHNSHMFCWSNSIYLPITVAVWSKARTVFTRSDGRILGSNPTQGTDVWRVYAFILCLCCPVFRYRPCDELITRPRRSTICEKWLRNWIRCLGPEWAGRAIEKENSIYYPNEFFVYSSFLNKQSSIYLCFKRNNICYFHATRPGNSLI